MKKNNIFLFFKRQKGIRFVQQDELPTVQFFKLTIVWGVIRKAI